MQPYIFPYLGYFQLIAAVDKFILFDDVHFINKGWINRNRLLLNNDIVTFTIPLRKASQNRLIKDLEISREIKWQPKLLKTIEMAYAKAPYFRQVFPIVNHILTADDTHISRLVHRSLLHVLDYLDVGTEVVASSAGYANGHLRGQHKILDICCQEQAGEYVNPLGGAALYERALFDQHGVHLHFLEPTLIGYPQFSSTFVPGLTILDVLMHNSPGQVGQMLLHPRLV
ncbi:WbqC family protein [Hymenobacter sp. B1770]|uniref:WbqC family protein n=1 Tax=Hymenobacter sp. B1770 TaxID=1718788 RepID=UPI003CF8B17E